MGSIRKYIGKKGRVSYHAEVRLKNSPVQRQVFRTATQAQEWINRAEIAIKDGCCQQTNESRRKTLGDAIDRFIQQVLSRHPKRQKKQTQLLTWWKEQLGRALLKDVQPSLIAQARDQLLSETTARKALRTPSTVNRYLAALSRVLSVAVNEWQWLPESPMKKVGKLRENKARDRLLSSEEMSRLLAACEASSSPFLYVYVRILLLTGFRHGECIALKWSDIDFERKRITIPETKNGSQHVLPLISDLENILQEHMRVSAHLSSELLFPAVRPHSKSGLYEIRKPFLKALEEAGITNFRIHDLRHAAASNMAMSGASQGEIMAFLNHKSPQMTRRYQHYSLQHLANVMDKSAAKISSSNLQDRQESGGRSDHEKSRYSQ